MHSRGVIHRDLKPENILLLDEVRDADTPKILDFGIAKLRTATVQTAEGTLIGTLMYMSPEQCRGETDIDPRSDIYSLGVILYECLTGVTPFVEKQVQGWLYAHLMKPVPDPAPLAPDAPPELCQLILRMLAKAPAERPASMEEVCAVLGDIEHALAKTEAPPPSGVQRRPLSLQRTPQPAAPQPSVVEKRPTRKWPLPVAGVLGLGGGVLLLSRLTGPHLPPALLDGGAPDLGKLAAAPTPPATPADPIGPPSPPLPAEMASLEGFAVSRAQVRIGDFHDFVADTHLTRAGKWPWELKVPPQLPMNNVAPALAARYCLWRYGQHGGRLPRQKELTTARANLPAPAGPALDQEWTAEQAARGPDKGSIKVGFRCAFTLTSKGTAQ